jgi:hypothetical protein
MTDILDLIDHAIEGCTSPDAMRWTPDPQAEPETRSAGHAWINGVDLSPFIAANGIELTPWQEDVVDQIDALPSRSLTIRGHFDTAALFRPRVDVWPIMQAIQVWLTANRIDPGVVPTDAVPVIVGRRIYCRVFVRDRRGQVVLERRPRNEVKTDHVSVRMRTRPPAELHAWLAAGIPVSAYRWLVNKAWRRQMHTAYSHRVRARRRRG